MKAKAATMGLFELHFHCSRDCPHVVKKKLQAFSGVESIYIDPNQGLVTVLGKVNPMVMVKLVQKMGQNAEL
ncbi:heavy metal-associated isoprenylated plant protein 28-like [Senna tora]|uniref:Heavy metal-associated isoprenylated plant protein 28-like n=1 Tax=Senna tora TaxID=362788 RepID=A0A834WQ47_9FABA|nr:heavy metal-associated isoprenylated plant protein 28-like [Senna tora]